MTTTTEQAGANTTDLNTTRTKTRPTPRTGTPGTAAQSDPFVTVDPRHAPDPHTASPQHAAEPTHDTEKRAATTTPGRWGRVWPSLLAVTTLSAVGGPAAVASYRHARDVITHHGDPVMAPWLALTTDGMLLAALVVIWVRRHRGEHVKIGPWAAFWAGMTVTIAANLAAAHPTPVGIVVALWPPVCLAITLELVALVAYPTKQDPTVNDVEPHERPTRVPDHASAASGPVPAQPANEDRAPGTRESGHDTSTHNIHQIRATPDEPPVETSRVPAVRSAGTNGHQHGHAPAEPAPADTYPSSGMKPRHDIAQSGHHNQAPSERVPDNDILAWLRLQTRTTGHVPGRRQTIDKWALGSTRAERLRALVIKETAVSGPPRPANRPDTPEPGDIPTTRPPVRRH